MKSDDVTPEQADNFLDTYVRRARKLVKEGAELDEQILEVENEIKKEIEARDKKKGSTGGMVSVVVMAKKEVDADFKLTYSTCLASSQLIFSVAVSHTTCLVISVVHGASWAPSYELHATTVSGKPSSSVSLHYRATITQSTGEDWTDVALTLSTASMDQADQQVPSIHALRIRPPTSGPVQPVWQQQAFQMQQQQNAALPARRGGFGSNNQATSLNSQPTTHFGGAFGGPVAHMGRGSASRPPPPPPPAPTAALSREEQWEDHDDFLLAPGHETETSDDEENLAMPSGTVINESPLSISYTVDSGQSSIPTDGVAHKVSVAELKFEAKVIHTAVPRVRAQAYLQVRTPMLS